MKRWMSWMFIIPLAWTARAADDIASVPPGGAPVSVALLDFTNDTGQSPDARLGGAVNPDALTQKGVPILGKRLLDAPGFRLIDRREFFAQMEKIQPADNGQPTAARTSFLRAAQALNAEMVVRGSLQSLSTRKESISQGGHRAEFTRLSLRIALEALDTHDGAVIAIAEGSATESVRQTEAVQTELGEEDLVALLDQAVGAALPKLQDALTRRQTADAARAKVKLNIASSADPAIVEIDGLMVGTTPIEGLEVYQGDHVLTVGKAGYRDVTKRILFDRDSKIEVPLFRAELNAEEMKAVMEKMRLSVVVGEPGIIVQPLE